MTPEQAAAGFVGEGRIARLLPLAGGNVNHSYLLVLVSGEEFVLQRLSPWVFPDPRRVMANLALVLEHLRSSLPDAGRRWFGWRLPAIQATPTGDTFLLDREGGLFRLLSFLDKTRTVDRTENAAQAGEMGAALGLFHRLTADLDPKRLAPPLPGFHDTPAYLARYDRIPVDKDPRLAWCQDFVARNRKIADRLAREEATGRLSPQVTHGDPKAANFLLDQRNDRVVSLIDLDTVGPGLRLHDLADCLRSCCNPEGEELGGDPPGFDLERCAALLRGYLDEAGHLLAPSERALAPDALLLICFELGLRFFSDHLEGDRYFKTGYPGHNLHRAEAQFRLFSEVKRGLKDVRDLCAR